MFKRRDVEKSESDEDIVSPSDSGSEESSGIRKPADPQFGSTSPGHPSGDGEKVSKTALVTVDR